MQATLNFPTRNMANDFSRAWAFYSLTGHTTSAGSGSVSVTVYDVSDAHKAWIENYIKEVG
jgi:hypothetical protein